MPTDRSTLGIICIIAGVFCISINDMLIKQLSGGYPLHELVLTRSAIGLVFSLIILQFEGGFAMLKTKTPWLHLIRCLMIVVSNMTYFVALAAMPLAEATALFFAAPLFITLLSIPLLKEKVGPLRLGAVIVGFIGVIIMQRPWEGAADLAVSRWVLLLPVIAALTYAMNQVMTRKLGAASTASALSTYIQVTFIVVCLGFFVIAGDGRFAEGTQNPSMTFLLRAWVWPEPEDIKIFLALGFNVAIIGYTLSQAYRLADAATIAPFEYIGLPLAVFWGWLIWRDLPAFEVWIGIALIVASGLFVFLRERKKARLVASKAVPRR